MIMICINPIWIVAMLTVILLLSAAIILLYIFYKEDKKDLDYFHEQYYSYYKKYHHIKTGLEFYLDVLCSDNDESSSIRSTIELNSMFKALINSAEKYSKQQ